MTCCMVSVLFSIKCCLCNNLSFSVEIILSSHKNLNTNPGSIKVNGSGWTNMGLSAGLYLSTVGSRTEME
jgi:hypothetical protein